MSILYRTIITKIGAEVAELLAGGVLILFADGAPPELAEMAVLHLVQEGPSVSPPRVGATVRIGNLSTRLTAIGDLAWDKARDLGHIVVSFSGASVPERRGELYASPLSAEALAAVLLPGNEIVLSD